MKDNLENAFKDSLEGYEAPYDPSVWDKVSSQLSASSGATSSTTTVLKWVVAGVLFGTVLTASYLLWYKDDTPNKPEIVKQNPVQKDVEPNTVKEVKENNPAFVSPKEDDEVSSDKTSNGVPQTNTDENTKVKEEQTTSTKTTSSSDNVQSEEQTDSKPPISLGNNSTGNDNINFVIGKVSSSVVCSGETVVIRNPSKTGQTRCQFLGKVENLKPGELVEFTPRTSMVIRFVNEDYELIESQYIRVHDTPTPDFTYDANIYEKGLPIAICKTFENYPSIQWEFNNGIKANGMKVKHHFFTKGSFDVSLTVEDENGCSGTVIKEINIRNKYNLMAVDAFRPNDRDARNRTFMPYSLKVRDVQFQLTIVDPRDNSVVFTSKDATNAWDGHDMKTGEMTPANKTYIWKVSIQNPLPHERPIYAGTVVHD